MPSRVLNLLVAGFVLAAIVGAEDAAHPAEYTVADVKANVLVTTDGQQFRLARSLPVTGAREQKAHAALADLVVHKQVRVTVLSKDQNPAEAEVELADGRNVTDEAGRLGGVFAMSKAGALPKPDRVAPRPALVAVPVPAPRQTQGTAAVVIGNPGEAIDITQFVVRGKTTIFDFSSPFCGPCRAAIPRLSKYAASRGDIAAFIVDINRPGVQGIDWQSPVCAQYQLHSVPSYVIFGPDGTLLKRDREASVAVEMLLVQAGF